MKALVSGMGVALAAGLLMGGAMKPDLNGDGRPAGPQILAGWSGQRSSGPFDDGGGFSGFAGQVPDYVTGTDWRKALERAAAPAPVEPAPHEAALPAAPAPAAPLKLAAAAETPAAPAAYPSLAGGTPYAADLPEPPPPPEDEPAVDAAPAA